MKVPEICPFEVFMTVHSTVLVVVLLESVRVLSLHKVTVDCDISYFFRYVYSGPLRKSINQNVSLEGYCSRFLGVR